MTLPRIASIGSNLAGLGGFGAPEGAKVGARGRGPIPLKLSEPAREIVNLCRRP